MALRDGVADATSREHVVYEGRPGLVGLLTKNFFLTLITIGIYRFWAATRLRRYLWSNIRIGGDGLEYTGTGRELFLGFLVGLAVLAPLSIVYIVAYRLSLGSSGLAAAIQGVYFIALFIFVQVALFRSRRYRLSRTTWRGIYAGQTGSTWHYLGLYLGYGVLTLVTLGLALPWMHVALARYKLDNTTFGDHRMHIDAKGGSLFGRWLVVIVLLLAPLVLAVLPNLSALLHPVYVPQPKGQPMLQLPHPLALLMILVALVAGGLALIWYRVEAFRYLAARVTLSPLKLHSAARGPKAVGQALLFGLGMIGIVVGVGILLAILSAVSAPLIRGMITGSAMTPGTAIMIGILLVVPVYVVMLWVMQLAIYCWLWIPIIKHLAATLAIENFAAADEIAQSTQPRPKLGIADSFELGAF